MTCVVVGRHNAANNASECHGLFRFVLLADESPYVISIVLLAGKSPDIISIELLACLSPDVISFVFLHKLRNYVMNVYYRMLVLYRSANVLNSTLVTGVVS